MAIFEIEAPDGKVYEIEGPDEAGAIDFLKQQLAAGTVEPIAPVEQAEPLSGDALALADRLSFLTTVPQSEMGKDDLASIASDQSADTRDMRRSEFSNLPWYQKASTALDDTARLGVDGLTFGFGDKLAAYMNSGDELPYDQALAAERDNTQAARDRAGSAGTAATIGGAILPASRLAKAGVTPFMLAPGAGAPLVTRAMGGFAAGGIEGAAYGALDALGHDTDVNDGAWAGSIGGAMGGAAAPAIAAAGSRIAGGVESAWNRLTGKGPAPRMTADKLRGAASQAYDDVDNMGVAIRPEALKNLAQGIDDTTNAARISPRANRSAYPVRQDVTQQLRSGKPMTLSQLDQERSLVDRNIVDELGAPNKEGRFAGLMQNEFDDFTGSLTPRDIRAAPGVDPQRANARLGEARELSSRSRKMGDFENISSKAKRRAAASKSGDLSTAVKGQVNSVLDKIDSGRIPAGRYTPDEVAQMNKIIDGTGYGRFMGKVADVTGGKIGVGMGAGLGGMTAGPWGAVAGGLIPSGVSSLARGASNRSTDKATQQLLDLIASGGTAPQVTKNAAQAIAERSPEDLARLLMLYSLTGE